jgi:hypothetical protein
MCKTNLSTIFLKRVCERNIPKPNVTNPPIIPNQIEESKYQFVAKIIKFNPAPVQMIPFVM